MARTIFKIGCDPEVFVTQRGKPASAYGLLEGTKEAPKKTRTGAYQVDGMAAEFNTDPLPLVNQNGWDQGKFSDWNASILDQMREIRAKLPDDYSLRADPTMEFGKEFLDAQPDEAKELGCDPDYNAYTLKPNPRPDGEATFRTGAGHIHVGWGADIPDKNEEHIEICAGFIKMMDATVGMFMTVIDRDAKRRELYGKAGAFRPKSYGVEYRTPSNAWLLNRDTRKCVWELTKLAIYYHKNGSQPYEVSGYGDVSKIINDGDHVRAKNALVHMYNNKNRYSRACDRVPMYMKRIFARMEKKYNA